MKEIENVASKEVMAKEAYARAKADWEKLEADQLLQVNLDIPTAAQTILGSLPEVRALRDELVDELKSFDVVEFDKMEDHVLGLLFVHGRYVTATQAPDDLATLSAAATALRERLTADARTLAVRGLFDLRKVEALKGSIGYRNVGMDLQSLSVQLEAVWPQIESKCATTRAELDAAGQMAVRLMRVVGVRDQAPVVLASLVEERMRAFTLVIKGWEDIRAGITYVRRAQEDVESIAPNLYTGKASRRKASETAEDGSAENTAPGTASVAPVAAALGESVAAAGGTVAPAPVATTATAEVSKRGPFIR